jgi:hypothetical protein
VIKNKLTLPIIITLISVFGGLVGTSCKDSINTSKSTGTFWYKGENGSIQTNDLARLKKEVPFKITLPAYLPNDLGLLPPMYVFLADSMMPDVWHLKIEYTTSTSFPYMEIEQINREMRRNPSTDAEVNYLTFGSVQVLESKTIEENWSSSGIVQETIYKYSWNKDGVNFYIYSSGFSEDTAKKIIGSMF